MIWKCLYNCITTPIIIIKLWDSFKFPPLKVKSVENTLVSCILHFCKILLTFYYICLGFLYSKPIYVQIRQWTFKNPTVKVLENKFTHHRYPSLNSVNLCRTMNEARASATWQKLLNSNIIVDQTGSTAQTLFIHSMKVFTGEAYLLFQVHPHEQHVHTERGPASETSLQTNNATVFRPVWSKRNVWNINTSIVIYLASVQL